MEVQFREFSSSALDEIKWSASRPNCFIPWERTHGIHWIRCWIGLGADVDAVKRKISFPRIKPQFLGCPASNQVTILPQLSLPKFLQMFLKID